MALAQRRLGRTGHLSSVVTFGSAGIGRVDQPEADLAIERALAAGVNHFDVAPTYGDAELRLAPWLPRIRDRIFLGCKTTARTHDEAKASLHRSLERLGVDRLDLFQLHSVGKLADLDRCTAADGALAALVEARDEGIVRWLGVTGHTHDAPATFYDALSRFDFDTVMLPFNFVLAAVPQYRRDWEQLMARCAERDVGVHVIKSAARGPWPEGDARRPYSTWYQPFDDQAHIDAAVAFVLDQPVTTLCSAGDTTILPLVLAAAERYQPLGESATQQLLASAGAYSTPFVGRWA